MNQRLERLSGCAPFIQAAGLKFIELAQTKLAIPLLVVTGFRSVKEQLATYAQGRTYDQANRVWLITDPGKVVTNALPGFSAHNVITLDGKPASLAIDVIPLDDAGQPEWQTEQRTWDALYELAWKCGLDPLGDLTGAYLKGDAGHLQEPGYLIKLDGLGLMQPAAVRVESV